MKHSSFAGKLNQADISILQNIERRILKHDIQAMEEWATFFAFNHPELVTDNIAKKILRFYRLAIAKNNQRAMLNLGALYYNGVFLQQDFSKAVRLYKMASNSDDPDVGARALCNLGYCYYYGRSITIDKGKAFSYFLNGVLKFNDPICLYKLGDMYRNGEIIEKDEKMAYALYKRARANHPFFEESLADILVRLGECELFGIGTKQDMISAIKHLTQAKGLLYERMCIKKDPFAQEVLIKTNKLIQEAENLLQGESQ